jgi:hypothetical protein
LLALPLYVLMLSMVGGVGRGDWALARKLLQAAPRQP